MPNHSWFSPHCISKDYMIDYTHSGQPEKGKNNSVHSVLFYLTTFSTHTCENLDGCMLLNLARTVERICLFFCMEIDFGVVGIPPRLTGKDSWILIVSFILDIVDFTWITPRRVRYIWMLVNINQIDEYWLPSRWLTPKNEEVTDPHEGEVFFIWDGFALYSSLGLK